MDNSETIQKTNSDNVLLYNTDYYRYIFKKTEKIVLTVFFVTNRFKDIEEKRDIIKETNASALDLLNAIHKTLLLSSELSQNHFLLLKGRLLQLESRLRILAASDLLENDLLNVFVAEIDTVMRNLSTYQKVSFLPLLEKEEVQIAPKRQPAARRESSAVEMPASNGNHTSEGTHLPNRRGRILQVIREKGNVSIKDISEIIKDCSEKTIQRELNSMIDEGTVLKKGQRRWSRYSIPAV